MVQSENTSSQSSFVRDLICVPVYNEIVEKGCLLSNVYREYFLQILVQCFCMLPPPDTAVKEATAHDKVYRLFQQKRPYLIITK